mgnify:CR=1 FL=1
MTFVHSLERRVSAWSRGLRKVRIRAKSILSICDDLLEEESNGASWVGGEVGGEPVQSGGSPSPMTDSTFTPRLVWLVLTTIDRKDGGW